MPKTASLSTLLEEPITPEDVLAYIKVMYSLASARIRILDLNDISNEVEIQFHPTANSARRRGWFPLRAGARHIVSLVNKSK